MIHRIPSGTRDVLPDELRELRAITEGIRGVLDGRGYGEVATPALEYEEVLVRGDAAAADPAYKLFDEHGDVLALRSDMTIPIARVVATRYASSPVPLRFSSDKRSISSLVKVAQATTSVPRLTSQGR